MTAPRRLQLRRGNTAAVSSYTGAAGELVVDTTTNTLYLHDGSTVGGYATTSNITAINNQISSVNANITAANLGMKGYVDSVASQSIYGNVNVQAYTESMGFQNFGNVNVAAYVTTANSAILGYIDLANTIQSAQVNAANLAITAANLGMKGYVDSVASQSIYGNGNVKSYLTQFDGNIVPSANVTYSLGSDTNRWKDLYLSGNTIFLGDTTISTSGGAVLTPVTRQLFSQSFLPTSTNSAATFTLDRLPTAGSTRTVVVIGEQGVSPPSPAPSYTLTEGVDFTISGLSLIITASYTATNISCTESYSDTGDLITATEVATDTITPGSGDLTVSGNVTVDGDLYVSPSSIYMGNLRISAVDGNLKVNTGIKFSDDSVQSTAYSNVGVATYLPTYSGNIAANISKAGYTWTFGTDGGLTLPGAAAGETIAISNGYITVGNLLIGQGGSLFNSNNDSWALYGNLSDSGTSISIPSNDSATNLNTALTIENQISNVKITVGFNDWIFGQDGNLTLPGNVAAINYANGVSILSGLGGGGGNYGNIDVKAFLGTDAGPADNFERKIEGYYANLILGDTTKLFSFGNSSKSYFGHDGFANININYVRADNSDVRVATNNGDHNWTFSNGGNLTLPAGGRILESTYLSADSIILKPNGGTSTQYLEIAPTAVDGNHVHLMTGSGTELFLGDDNHYVKLANTGGVVINSNDGTGNTAQWTFGKTGTTQFPGSKILAPAGESITMQSDNYSQLMWENANVTVAPNMATYSNFYVSQNNATLDIGYLDGSSNPQFKEWLWSVDGNLKLPSGGYILNSDDSIYGGGDYSNVQVAAYLNTQGYNLYSNVNVAAYLSTATINTTGNITAQNLIGNISITGNVTGTSANVTLQAGAYTSVFDNQGNVRLPTAYVTGNVTANYFIGNGALLTGIAASSNYGNVNVATYLPTYSGVVGASNVFVSGNVTANYFLGNGALLTGIASSYSNVQVATYLPTYTGNIANVRLSSSGALTFPDGTQQTTAAFGGGGNYGNANVAAFLPTYTGTTGITQVGTLATLNVTGNTTVGNLIGTEANTRIIANVYTTTFDIYGNVSFPGNLTVPNSVTVGGNLTVTGTVSGGTIAATVYLLEAYASVTYTLPGSFTEDPCRYSVVSSNVNVSSSWFDTSTYTFTPQKAGYWEIIAAYDVYRNAESSLAIKKNNSIVASAGSFNAVAQQITKIIYLNGSTDSANVVNVGGAALSRSQYDGRSWFQARWIGA